MPGTGSCFQDLPFQCAICAPVGLAVPTAQASVAETVATPLSCPSSESWGLGGTGIGTATAFQDVPLKWYAESAPKPGHWPEASGRHPTAHALLPADAETAVKLPSGDVTDGAAFAEPAGSMRLGASAALAASSAANRCLMRAPVCQAGTESPCTMTNCDYIHSICQFGMRQII